MTVSAEGTARIRAASERILTDACTVTREGTAVTSRTDGSVTRDATTIYVGRCLVTAAAGSDTEEKEPGRKKRTEDDYRGRLPVEANSDETGDPGDVAVGDIVTVDTSDDPSLVGRTFRVTQVIAQTYASSRRLVLVAYSAGVRS